MLKIIGASALKDSIGMLKSETNFFQIDTNARKMVLEAKLPGYPGIFVDYFSEISGDVFLTEMKEAVQILRGFTQADSPLGLLGAMATYISEDLGAVLDKLDSDFFFMDLMEREKALKELLPGHSALMKAVREMFVQSTYQEVTAMATEALETIKNIPIVVIQTPIELPSGQRAGIRKDMNAKYPGSFTEFQINPQIIGGMRVFVDGEVADHSWLAKIQAMTSLSA